MNLAFINHWYPKRVQQISLLTVILFAILIRLFDLGRGAVWWDEALEYWTASAGTSEIIQAVSEKILDPPFYSLILHFWMSGGNTEGYLRLPSVIFSIFTLFGVMVAAYQLGGTWASLLAGLFMAISPIDIRYAQEIGQYSLLLCLVIWSANCFIYLHKGAFDWRVYVLWLVFALAAAYTHYGALFPILTMIMVDAIINGFNRSWKRMGVLSVTTLLFLAGILPIILFILPSQLRWAPITDINELSLSIPTEAYSAAFLMIKHTFSFLFTAWPFTYLPEWLPNILVGLTISISLFKFKKVARLEQIWIAWLLLTICFYMLIVQLGQYPAGYRHSMFLLVLLVPLMTSTFTRLFSGPKERLLSYLLIGTYLTISIISIPNITFRNLIYPKATWPWPETNYILRPTIDYWLKHRQHKEPIYVYYGGVFTFRYYLQVLNKEKERPPYNWNIFKKYKRPRPPLYIAYGKWLRGRPAEELSGDVLNSLSAKDETFWIIFSYVRNNEDQLTMEGLLRTYAIDVQVKTNGSTLYHLILRQ
jgi:uncharacterized membrane protein